MNDCLSWRTKQNSQKNRFKYSTGVSFLHESKKFEICFCLSLLDLDYYCEAIFANKKGRADIYVPEKDVAIEVLNTEEEADFEKKKDYYPCRVVRVSVLDKIDTDYLLRLVN